MLDFLFKLFKREFALAHSSIILSHIADVIKLIEDEYTQDKNAKNAAIDAIVKIIQDYKDPS